MTPNNTLGAEFIAQLARGGFAETMTDSQRAAIHIETRLDEFLEEALDDGKQIVLTGNPGDGKTQYILMQERRRGAPGNAYYLPDASSESDYSTVLEEWKEALSDGRPGILAINEGPLYEMLTHHQDEYEFLDTVAQQLDNQIVLDQSSAIRFDDEDILVLNLNHRNVLSRPIALQAIRKLTNGLSLADLDGHIEYNVSKLQNESVQENFKRIFERSGKSMSRYDPGLLNFIAHCITGGESEAVEILVRI